PYEASTSSPIDRATWVRSLWRVIEMFDTVRPTSRHLVPAFGWMQYIDLMVRLTESYPWPTSPLRGADSRRGGPPSSGRSSSSGPPQAARAAASIEMSSRELRMRLFL